VNRFGKTIFWAVLVGLSGMSRGWACAACYGASDSPLAKGMNWGIMALLCCILGVLVGVTSFFVYIVRRSHSETESAARPVSTDSKP